MTTGITTTLLNALDLGSQATVVHSKLRVVDDLLNMLDLWERHGLLHL